jgi:hypothetical protein
MAPSCEYIVGMNFTYVRNAAKKMCGARKTKKWEYWFFCNEHIKATKERLLNMRKEWGKQK